MKGLPNLEAVGQGMEVAQETAPSTGYLIWDILYRYPPGSGTHWSTELMKLPGKGMKAIQGGCKTVGYRFQRLVNVCPRTVGYGEHLVNTRVYSKPYPTEHDEVILR